MSYIVLSRKYRPKSFNEIVGQEHIVNTLANAIQTNRVAHAYLFAGPRGVGKTSMARILSKALNCQKGPTDAPCNKCSTCESIRNGNDIDVLEIDGASNRGIDEIRSIRQNVGYAPAISRYKIYIIDEVHMLTREAFNAILKTLEEPPGHVKFIFATTSPNRVPDTVQSRCQRFDFKNISVSDISNRLAQICKTENILAEDGALQTIAKYAMGGLRDSESILDQLTSFCREKITLRDIYDVLGVVSEEEIASLIDSFVDKNPELAVKGFHEITENGKDVDGFIDQLLSYIRDLLLVSICNKDSGLAETISRDINLLQKQASRLSLDTLMYMIQLISEIKSKGKDLLQQKILLEVVLIKLATMEDLKPIDAVLNRIEDIKRSFEGNVNGEEVKAPDCGDSVGVARNTEIRESSSDDYIDTSESSGQDTNISNTWDKIMAEIQDKKKSVWVLLRDAELLNFADNEVVLEFPGNYLIHKERLEKPEEKRIIEACIEKVTGKKIPVRLTISKNGRRMMERNKDERTESDIINDPIVKRTREIFDGSIVNIRGTER
ncbi:MAG: DNA polymerase III subunit gamma/tau [Planctomycetota bacterium]|jgi:DNA polymerase-3 subunit gamma/tau